MGMDRFIKWGKPQEWGAPTVERLAQVARDYLGARWSVRITSPKWIVCETDEPSTAPLKSEFSPGSGVPAWDEQTRGFEIFFPDSSVRTSVITRRADEFTNAVADGYTKCIARWWNGEIEWPS